eukprot:3211866-Prymnesium_polylepis.1
MRPTRQAHDCQQSGLPAARGSRQSFCCAVPSRRLPARPSRCPPARRPPHATSAHPLARRRRRRLQHLSWA